MEKYLQEQIDIISITVKTDGRKEFLINFRDFWMHME